MPSFETTRRVAFTARQMFDLVADVESYPQFFPLCEALKVRERMWTGDVETLIAEMRIGYRSISETIVSRVTLERSKLVVQADLVDGPFRQLANRWSFADVQGGADVRFAIAYEFKSRMLQLLVGAMFDQAFGRCTEAFEERAGVVYGRGGSFPLNV